MKPPAKHVPHGNYRRADYFEERCRQIEAERDRVQQSHDYWDKKHAGLENRVAALESAIKDALSGTCANWPDRLRQALDTWKCANCGQLNSGWATHCGRCLGVSSAH